MKRTAMNDTIIKRTFFAFVLCLCAAVVAPAQTSVKSESAPPADPHAGHNMSDAHPAAKDDATPAQKYFGDVELIDQDGKPHRFYSDLLKGKTIVANAFFTTCTSVCPPMTRNLEKVQEALGERFGRDVFFVSISVDPEMDTPARLKDYAAKFHAKPGWIFLTGKKDNVDQALYKLGQYVEDKNDHTTVIIIGNEVTGIWKKAFGMAQSGDLLKLVEGVADDKGATAAKQN